MSDLRFKVNKVFPGTSAQTNVGIYATFNMDVENADGILLTVNDMKLMKSRDGKYYVESPFRTYDGKDKDGNPKKVKLTYVKFFPEQKNWDKQDAIVKLVMDQLPAPGTTPPKTNNNNYGGKHSSPTPQPRPAAKATNNEPW